MQRARIGTAIRVAVAAVRVRRAWIDSRPQTEYNDQTMPPGVPRPTDGRCMSGLRGKGWPVGSASPSLPWTVGAETMLTKERGGT